MPIDWKPSPSAGAKESPLSLKSASINHRKFDTG
jgi:hypothetical protein